MELEFPYPSIAHYIRGGSFCPAATIQTLPPDYAAFVDDPRSEGTHIKDIMPPGPIYHKT